MAFLTAAARAGCSAASTASICVSDLQLRTVRTGTRTDLRHRHNWHSLGQPLATAIPASMDVACQGDGAARHPPKRRWKSAGRAGPAQAVNIAMGVESNGFSCSEPFDNQDAQDPCRMEEPKDWSNQSGRPQRFKPFMTGISRQIPLSVEQR